MLHLNFQCPETSDYSSPKICRQLHLHSRLLLQRLMSKSLVVTVVTIVTSSLVLPSHSLVITQSQSHQLHSVLNLNHNRFEFFLKITTQR